MADDDDYPHPLSLNGELMRLRAELAVANEVIERLVKTEHKVANAIGDAYLLDLPDGGDVKLWEGVERIKAELAAERERRGDLSEWELHVEIELLRAKVAKLREALVMARVCIDDMGFNTDYIDAVLEETKGGGDE